MKVQKYLTLFALFAIPISAVIPIRGANVWYSQYLCLLCLLFFGISVKLWSFNRFMSVFVTMALYSAVFIGSLHPKSVLILIQIALSSLAVMCIGKLNRRDHIAILKGIVWLIFIQGAYVILQRFNMDPIFDMVHDRVRDDTVGFSGNHNQIGLFFAVTAPVALYLAPAFLVFTGLGLWWSTTSIAFVGAASGLLLIVFYKFRKALTWVVTGLAVVSIFYIARVDGFSDQKLRERLDLWKFSISAVEKGQIRPRIKMKDGTEIIKVVTCNKWFGFGNGAFMSLSPYAQKDAFMRSYIRKDNGLVLEQSHVYEHAHNDYIEFYFDYGRFGGILLVLFLIDLVRKFIRSRKTAILLISGSSLLSFAVCVTFIYGMQTAVSGMLFIILLGVFLGEVRRQDGQVTGLV